MAELNQARNSISSVPSQNPNPLQRRSHVSISPRMSAHSWGNAQLEVPPSQATQPPPSPRRGPLRMTNPDEDAYADLDEEYMNIEANVSGTDGMGYQPVSGKLKKDQRAKKRRFVGGFVKGLRKFGGTVLGYGGNPNPPLMRTTPENSELTAGRGETLPRYVSNPTTLVTPQATQRPRRPLPSTPHPDVVDGLPPALVPGPRRPRPPSFHITPPPISQRSSVTHMSELPSNHPHVDRSSSTAIPIPLPATAQSNDNIDTPIPSRRSTSHQSHSHLERSSHPTRIEVDDDQGTIVRSPSARSPGRHSSVPPIPATPNPERSRSRDQSHPASVLVRPLPTEDYRRMSKSITHNTIASSSISYEPSFSTELSPLHGFFHTLWHMPWVAADRITVDYFPGMSRGAWEWKRVAARPERTSDPDHTKERIKVEYKPVAKPLKSWYTGVSPMSQGSMPSWARSADPEAGGVDLLSSGTSATRSSVATSNGPNSPPLGTGRKRFSQRESRRLYYSPNQYTFVDAFTSTPPLRVKKRIRQEHRSRNGQKSSHRSDRHRRHHRTSSNAPPPIPPIPPAAYMPGYVPYQPSAPLYFFQSPTLGPAHHSHPNVDPHSPPSDSHQAYQNQQSLLSPLLMVPGIPTVVPFQSGSVADSTGTASPPGPGVAGRSAGGAYGPSPGVPGNFPGIFTYGGLSPVIPSASRPNPG
ncbi:hypothetical protein L218DRAFT_275018 [Marasmius fiardii PR-910]|nr:hypothetical protein L218DRAFT_275018 [Marasmius fiardii PR-910]